MHDFLDAFDAHAAGGHRQARQVPAQRFAGTLRNRQALVPGQGKAATLVGENRRIGAEQAKQATQKQGWCDPQSGQRRMRKQRNVCFGADHFGEDGDPEDERAAQQGANTFFAGNGQVPRNPAGATGQGRGIDRVMPGQGAAGCMLVAVGARYRPLDPRHTLREWRRILIGDAVVVLDDVDTGACEHIGECGQCLGVQTLWLERGATERAPGGFLHECLRPGGDTAGRVLCARPVVIPASGIVSGASLTAATGTIRHRQSGDDAPPAGAAEARSGHGYQQCGRQFEVEQFDIGLQRTVAAGHVEQLARLGAGRRDGQRDRHLETVGGSGDRLDRHDFAGDPRADPFVTHRLDRHLDRLLECQGARAGGDGVRPAVHPVQGVKTVFRHPARIRCVTDTS